MKKNILTTILIISLFIAPFFVYADLPIFEDDGGTGDGGGYTGGGNTGSSGNTGTPSGFTSTGTSIKSDLFVETNDADFITYTTARLHGRGGDKLSNRTLPITAYFRYSKSPISPIFCNDIYGSNMISTKDIPLGITASKTFYQNISNLIPDTTYYYCAIVSNKESIAYGGNTIVKEFHTSPNKTTIRTESPTSITSNSAILNGSYSSIENVTTSFQYKASTTTNSSDWKNVCEKKHIIPSGIANIYGKITCDLSELDPPKLTPYTRYQFRTVAKNISGTGENTEEKIFYGTTINFTTSQTVNTTGTKNGGTKNTDGGTCVPGSACESAKNGTSKDTTATKKPTVNNCRNGADNYPSCTTKNGICINGKTNPPLCANENDTTDTGTWDPGTGTWGSGTGTGTWGSGTGGSGNGTSGTWGTGTGTGTWTATTGTGGSGPATWYGNGDGTGTWTSATGSGTWTNGLGTGGAGTGTWGQPLTIGQTATPPNDAIVRYHEGIETVFVRQIMKNEALASKYGYQEGTDLQSFAWYLADEFAKMFGYIDSNRKEIRVSKPDIAAYQLSLLGNQLTVYEYYDNRIVDVRNITTNFKEASEYEYYFKKN